MQPIHTSPVEPSRQIHLDFHTSEYCDSVGLEFDKNLFKEGLRRGRVNQINLFAKCHHSWCYYPTEVGKVHPGLNFDLLGQQIEACRELGVHCPIYVTVGWSSGDVNNHPEWCMRTRDGSLHWREYAPKGNESPGDPFPYCSWAALCPSGAYHDHIMALVAELLDRYDPVDGFFFDIHVPKWACYCDNCLEGMAREGLDIDNLNQVLDYRARVIRKHADAVSGLILSRNPGATIFYNGLAAIPVEGSPEKRYGLNNLSTKNDLEHLPSVWGGYDVVYNRAKYFNKDDKALVWMSGKFHEDWGEFGGYKNPEALRYEAAQMISLGASCNFGDQLHPSGLMDMGTYEAIGYAYSYVETIEEYGIGGRAISNLGVIVSGDKDSDQGVAQMLLEEQINYDVIRSIDEISRFETVIIPSFRILSDKDARAIRRWFEEKTSRHVIILGEGALNRFEDRLLFHECGKFEGHSCLDVDYVKVHGVLLDEIVPSPVLNYSPGLRISKPEGAEVFADLHEPFFKRCHEKYNGHREAPPRLEATGPAIFKNGNVVCCVHALDRMYLKHGAYMHRHLFCNLVRHIHSRPILQVDLPSAARVSLLQQPHLKRYVLHLLYAPVHRRGSSEVVEDFPEIRDIFVRLDVSESIQRVRLIPDKVELPFHINKQCETTIPVMRMHCALVFEYQ